MVSPINLTLDTTYEQLLQYKLNNTSNELDKREISSMLYNAYAGNSLETAGLLFTMQQTFNLVFADTATREYLIRRAAERGLTPLPATFATRRGVFNIDVPIGSRFSIEDVNYTVVSKLNDQPIGNFTLRAETAGSIGNAYTGTLLPVTYISGLTQAQITDILVPGEDEEPTEIFRQRYFRSFQSQAFGGNRANYKEVVNAIPGVGGTKVYRAWNGGGTVRLVIIDSNFNVPSNTLVEQVQQIVDPPGFQGEGVGTAPIDHVVTVQPVTATTVDIAFTIDYATGWDFAAIEQQLQQAVDTYFNELGREFAASNTLQEDNSGLTVRVSQLETRVLGLNGVVDVRDTTLNGNTSNLVLANDAIPVRGTVSG